MSRVLSHTASPCERTALVPFPHIWTQYCLQEGIEPLPVSEGQLAAWLAAMALSDKTTSPTDNRYVAILYFHRIAGGVTSDDMEIV
jgi:hypothetical protein